MGERVTKDASTLRLSRRQSLGLAAATGVMLAAPAVMGQARARVVVVGGGAAGAAAARRMAGTLDVTLIEPNPVYKSCFFSNLALGGFLPFDVLSHSYDGLVAAGVRLVSGRAAAVETTEVLMEDGTRVPFDRCVLAPGIAYRDNSLAGWSPEQEGVIPSAYVTGGNPERIREQVLALPQGGTWCIVVPPDLSRCPPAPYERVSMVAHLLASTNPTAKILIVDPKPGFAKQALFEEGWQNHYTGMIDRLGPDFGGDKVEIDAANMQVIVDGVPEAADAINVIPAQWAGPLALASGVVDETGWCPVAGTDMRSDLRGDLHVLGDAARMGRMPKAASSAVSQAQVVADTIVAELAGGPMPDAQFASICWSAIADGNSVKEQTVYGIGPDGPVVDKHEISQTGEDPELRKRNWDEAFAWYAAITTEIFG